MIKTTKFIITLFFIYTTSILTGQQSMTLNELLASASKQSLAVEYTTNKIEALNSFSKDLGYIDKFEVRTKTNEFSVKQQEYLLRVTPNTQYKRKIYKIELNSNIEISEINRDTEVSEALSYIYNLLVDLKYTKKERKIVSRLNLIEVDKISVLQKSISLRSFDIMKLIEAQEKNQKIEIELFSIDEYIEILEEKLDLLSNGKFVLLDEMLPNISQLELLYTSLISGSSLQHPDLKILNSRMKNIKSEQSLVNSIPLFSIGYMQAQYGYNSEDSFFKNFSIGIGFDLNMLSTTEHTKNELNLELVQSESSYKIKENEISELTKKYKNDFKRNLSIIKILSKHISNKSSEYALIEYQKQNMASPLTLLKLKEVSLEQVHKLLLSEHNIFKVYVSLLSINGLLSQKPYINYFDKNLERI